MIVAATIGHAGRPSRLADRGAVFEGVEETSAVCGYTDALDRELRRLGLEPSCHALRREVSSLLEARMQAESRADAPAKTRTTSLWRRAAWRLRPQQRLYMLLLPFLMFGSCLDATARPPRPDREIERARRMIDRTRYLDAEDILRAVLERDGGEPEALLLLAEVIEHSCATTECDRERLALLSAAHDVVTDVGAHPLMQRINADLDAARAKVMESDYSIALQRNTASAFADFLERWPDTDHAEEALRLHDDAVAREILADGSVQAHREFLNSLVGQRYYRRPEIEGDLWQLAYNEAVEAGDDESLLRYLRDYPRSPFALEAGRRLAGVVLQGGNSAALFDYLERCSEERLAGCDEGSRKVESRLVDMLTSSADEQRLNEYLESCARHPRPTCTAGTESIHRAIFRAYRFSTHPRSMADYLVRYPESPLALAASAALRRIIELRDGDLGPMFAWMSRNVVDRDGTAARIRHEMSKPGQPLGPRKEFESDSAYQARISHASVQLDEAVARANERLVNEVLQTAFHVRVRPRVERFDLEQGCFSNPFHVKFSLAEIGDSDWEPVLGWSSLTRLPSGAKVRELWRDEPGWATKKHVPISIIGSDTLSFAKISNRPGFGLLDALLVQTDPVCVTEERAKELRALSDAGQIEMDLLFWFGIDNKLSLFGDVIDTRSGLPLALP